MLGEDGSVCVLDTAFDRKLLQFETRATTPPSQVAWCGEDAIAVVWQGSGDDDADAAGGSDDDDGDGGPRGGGGACVLLIGPFGDYIRYEPDDLFGGAAVGSGLVVAQEADG